ncbi:MAG: SpoIIE family protein phosphatase, partial [Clostridia bacterium]
QGLSYEKVMMEYLIILFMGIALLKLADEYRKTRSQQGYLLMIGMLLCIFSEFAFVSYASVYDAYNYLGHIYKFTAFFIMFKALYTDNVRVPYREMKKARNELKKYTENLNFLVKQQTKKIEDVNERLIMDLEYAKDIQRSFLPAKMPEDITVSFEAGYLAAERLSGDFYNVIKLDENNVALYIGDVAGHGVSAAMLMVFANQNIKPLKETEDSVEIISPGYALKNLYKAFNQTNFKAETYMVMLYGIYNTQSRVFTYASGGMNVPPLIVKNSGGIIEMDAAGFAICKLGDVIMPFFEDKQIQLESGDKLLFYTDGLVEAENQEGYKYTSYHLNELVKENHSLNIHGFADAIRNDIFEFVENEGRLKDDVTFLIMEVH